MRTLSMPPAPPRQNTVPLEKYLDLLNLLSELVASEADAQSILQSTVRLIQGLVKVERCSILLLDASGEFMTLGASAGIPECLHQKIHVRLGEGIAGQVAQSGEPIHNIAAESGWPSVGDPQTGEDDRYTTSSFISVPIRHQDKSLGVINVTNKQNRANLDAQDLELLKSVARFLGLVIEKHRLHYETERLHEHLIRTVESLPVGLMTVGPKHKVLTANSSALRLLDMKPLAGAEGRVDLFEVLDRATALQLASLTDATFRQGKPQEREIELKKGETTTPLRLTSRLVKARSGWIPEAAPPGGAEEPGGDPSAAETSPPAEISPRAGAAPASEIAILVEDLSLRRELQELRKLDELKSNFISLVSHELRTPLTSVRGAVHLLGNYYAATLDEMQRNLVRIIQNNADRLIAIVNNILDISLLDNQSLHLEIKRVDINEILQSCVDEVESIVVEKGIQMMLAFSPGPLWILGDGDRLRQIFQQILSNAIKFSPAMVSVEISSSRLDGDAIVDMSDSGEGIPPEIRERIFARFHQAESPLTRRTGGVGLGLYLARALTEIHGGAIEILEPEKSGAHVRIRLPLEDSQRSLKMQEEKE